MPHTTRYAAVDLGSNSFHLVICNAEDAQLTVVDKLKERVRLAAGLDEANRLSEDAQWRALAALRRFGQRLAEFNPERVRVVATNTLRKAVNRETFLAQAREALGHPIEVISGQEEARLVFLGVNRSIEGAAGRRLVVDIGGGSTECIVGEVDAIARADSLHMGCVSWTQRFFKDGKITADRLDEAIIAARLELGPVQRLYRELGWDVCYGSSGTVNAIQSVLTECGWCEHVIKPEGLDRLQAKLVEAGRVDNVDLPGLKPERRDVVLGGFAVLRAVFRAFKIKAMVASKAALREGVVFDLMGRAHHADVRDGTVSRLQARFGLDVPQAERVAEVALRLLDQVGGTLGLPRDEAAEYLGWAAQLHEIGKAVSYTGHHKHGAYIVAHAEMPGFSQGEQAILAALLLGHRRKYKRERIEALGVTRFGLVEKLTLLLRLAVALNRTRSPQPRPEVALKMDGMALELVCPPGYLADRPLTRADLETEARVFASLGYTLTWA
ncbi:MAG: exopolyphosphatase [Myxococcales bacterium]|nr:exopolyphosphatase [Myxococcales bacterium]